MDDILQSGYEGLWKSCLNFDSTRGLEFSTYAVPMIRGHILRELRDITPMKEPRWFQDIRSALSKYGINLPLSEEDIDFLVLTCNLSREQFLEYDSYSVVSLDSFIYGKNTDEGRLISETIPDPSQNIEDKYSEEDIESIVDGVVKYMSDKHKDIVEEWMYSVLADENISQVDLGKKYGISQAQTSRVLKSAVSIIKMHEKDVKNLFGL